MYLLEGSTSLGVFTVNGAGTPTSWYFTLLAGDKAVGRQPNTGNRRYYHSDMLGSTRSVVEGATVVESYDFEPWGLLMPGRTLGSGTKEGYTGKEMDAESALDYFGARYYMPALGRFASVDPVSDAFPDWSGYVYTLDNPTGVVDPDGRVPILAALAAAWAIYEVGSAVYDVYQAGRTLFSGRTSTRQKVTAVVAAGVSVVGPGGGYTAFADDVVESGSRLLRRSGKLADDAAETAPEVKRLTPQQRGRESEARVLKDRGETKNTQTLETSEGNTIPDFQNTREIGEIKDTKRVSDTRQVRAQREAAQSTGREHVVVTGRNTKVAETTQRKSRIERRDDLGPQNQP